MQPFDTSRVRRRSSFGIVAALILIACSCASDPASPSSNVDLHATVISDEAGLPNDPLAIDSVHIVGDTLVAVVSHGGGCAEHAYQLVIGTAWMESFPVQVRARIAHNANGDMCKALLRRELRMGLRPLADAYRAAYRQEHGSVLIQLPGDRGPLLYRF